ncbi:hypothetical protein [Ruegeria arenilitoris]|uniref:hypothetical protein n=1 Tax=Ruegeria arenilitoris TaxID=1173585 RepID=UPI0014816630|nr:hypothetical protein [Ruegeria arenilitoris]
MSKGPYADQSGLFGCIFSFFFFDGGRVSVVPVFVVIFEVVAALLCFFLRVFKVVFLDRTAHGTNCGTGGSASYDVFAGNAGDSGADNCAFDRFVGDVVGMSCGCHREKKRSGNRREKEFLRGLHRVHPVSGSATTAAAVCH